jgi:hypothetical protein
MVKLTTTRQDRQTPAALFRALVGLTGLLGITIGQQVKAIEIEPTIGAGLVYTDNLYLASEDDEISEIVAQILPGLGIIHEADRVQFNLDGELQLLFYQDNSDGNAIFANGSTELDLVLIRDHLFLDTFGSISQTPVDPTQPIPSGNIPITGNRTDLRILQTSPRWQSLLLGNELRLEYEVGKIDYDDPDLQDTLFHRVSSSYGSQPEGRGFGWSLNHDYASYEYNLPPTANYQTLAGNIDYTFGGGFALTGMYGFESDYLDYSSSEMTEEMWSMGFRMSTEDMSLIANFGDRSYGSTAYLSFSWNLTNNGFFMITYTENPATTESLAHRRLKPDDPEIPPIPPLIDEPGTAQTFINKRFQATLSKEFSKNTLTLSGYTVEQTDYVTQDGSTPRDDGRQNGVILDWLIDAGNKTDLTVTGRWVNRELPESGDDTDIYVLRFSLLYQLGQRTSLDFWVQHTKDDGAPYTENQVGFMANRSF